MGLEIRAFELKKKVDRAISSPLALAIPGQVRELIAEMAALLADMSQDVADLREAQGKAARDVGGAS